MIIYIDDGGRDSNYCNVWSKKYGSMRIWRGVLKDGRFKISIVPGDEWELTRTSKDYCRLDGPNGTVTYLCLRVVPKIFGMTEGRFGIKFVSQPWKGKKPIKYPTFIGPV